MSKFIKPVGECESTGKKQYITQSDCEQVCEWANNKNESEGNPIRTQAEYCEACGYWHVVPIRHNKQVKQVSQVDDFFEQPREMTIEEMIKKLSEAGYWVVEPENVEKALRRLKFVKELLEAEKENA